MNSCIAYLSLKTWFFSVSWYIQNKLYISSQNSLFINYFTIFFYLKFQTFFFSFFSILRLQTVVKSLLSLFIFFFSDLFLFSISISLFSLLLGLTFLQLSLLIFSHTEKYMAKLRAKRLPRQSHSNCASQIFNKDHYSQNGW
jgi:hypothetical protein